MAFDAKAAHRRVEQAMKSGMEKTARLFRPDGSPTFFESEHQERLAAIAADVEAEVVAVEGQLSEERDRIRREEQELNRVALFRLEGEHLARANALSQFVRDDVEHLDGDSPLDAVDAAIATDDRAALMRYDRHATASLASHRDASVTGQLNETQATRFRLLDTVRRKRGTGRCEDRAPARASSG